MNKNPVKYVTVNENEKLEDAKQHARDKQMAKTKLYQKAEAKVKAFNEGKPEDSLTVEEFEAYTGIMFSHNMSGKMEGVLAISTNCKANPYCKARLANGESICASCFAQKTENHYYDLYANTALNAEILSTEIIPWELIPKINTDIVRIEAFGDLINPIQSENYLRIIIKNPDVRFGWWTKNPNFIHVALRDYHNGEVPNNVQIVLSSLHLNEETKINPKFKYFISKVFTVYTPCYFNAMNIDMESFINCGARSCKKCQKCYHKADYNVANKQNTIIVDGVEYVRELLK